MFYNIITLLLQISSFVSQSKSESKVQFQSPKSKDEILKY